MHPRKALREAFKQRLINATACEDRVFSTMTPPIDLESIVEEGPVMLIYLHREESREEDYTVMGEDGAKRRRPELTIEVLATGSNVDDVLDDIAEVIESRVENWEIPGFPAVDPLLISSQINVTDTHERIYGGIYMNFHMKVWSDYRKDNAPGWMPDTVFSHPLPPQTPEQIIFEDDPE